MDLAQKKQHSKRSDSVLTTRELEQIHKGSDYGRRDGDAATDGNQGFLIVDVEYIGCDGSDISSCDRQGNHNKNH